MDEIKRTVIAVKSSRYIAVGLFGAFVFLFIIVLLWITYGITKQLISLIASILPLVIFIVHTCMLSKELFRPKTAIKCYGDGIIINYAFGKKVDIKLADITDFESHPVVGKWKVHDHGELFITARGIVYNSGMIDDVRAVEKLLRSISAKYQH